MPLNEEAGAPFSPLTGKRTLPAAPCTNEGYGNDPPLAGKPHFALHKGIAIGFLKATGFRNKPKRTIFDLWCSDPWTSEQVIVANVGELRAISHVHRKSDQVEADGMDEEQATPKVRETDRRERQQRRSRRLRWGLICRVAGGRAGPGRRWISCGRRVR